MTNRPQTSIRLAVLLASVALAVTACGGGDDGQILTLDGPFSVVAVAGDSGDITVTGRDDATDVTIETVMEFSGDQPTLETSSTDGVLTVTTPCDDCSVTYIITVPRNVTVELTTESGDITVTTIDGDALLSTPSGSVALNEIGGLLDIDIGSGTVIGVNLTGPSATVVSDSGRVDLTYDDPVDDVTIVTGSGNITVQVPDPPYAVNADTSGDIDINIDVDDASSRLLSLTAETGSITVYRK